MCACTCIVVRLCVAFFFAVFAVSFDVANEGSGKIEKSDDHSFSVCWVARSVVGNVFLCCQDCSKTVQGNLKYICTIFLPVRIHVGASISCTTAVFFFLSSLL